MSTKKDYYEILGVNRSADASAIKRAYRKLAKKYHPDSNSGNTEAEEKFKEITKAYQILGDEEKRKLYDRYGHAAFEEGAEPGGFRESHTETAQNMDDLFKDIFGNRSWNTKGGNHGGKESGSSGFYKSGFYSGGFENEEFHNSGFHRDGFHRSGFNGGGFGSDGFEDIGFGREGFWRRNFDSYGFDAGTFSGKGENLHAEVEVSFDEAAFGGSKVIHLSSKTATVESLQITIPAGIESGKTIRLKGKGRPGRSGGEPGDLLLKVMVREKPGFRREGIDVYTTVSVPFITAVLGGEVKIHTLYGDVLCKIKEGTQSGTKIRLRGKGIVSVNNPSVYGDQYAVVEIQVPRGLSQEAKRKLREFDEAQKKTGSHRGSVA